MTKRPLSLKDQEAESNFDFRPHIKQYMNMSFSRPNSHYEKVKLENQKKENVKKATLDEINNERKKQKDRIFMGKELKSI